MKKQAYVILTHHRIPARDQGYRLIPGKMQVNETCEFTDRVKNKHISTASLILDLINSKIVKGNIDGYGFEDMLKHVYMTYPEKLQEFTNLIKNAYDIDVALPTIEVSAEELAAAADMIAEEGSAIEVQAAQPVETTAQ